MTARSPVLLLGAGGQLGTELREALAGGSDLVCADLSGDFDEHADLADPGALDGLVERLRPRAVVNAAAWTDVDGAEREPEMAERVNAEAPAVLAAACARLDAVLVHYSTDYVFDGATERDYREDDVPRPLGVYGRSKLAGERAVIAAGGAHFVLRTSWLYAAHGRNFVRTVLRLADGDAPIRIVDDQHGTPTSARALAGTTRALLGLAGTRGAAWARERAGLYHAVGPGHTTWCGLARAVIETLAPGALGRLQPIATRDYPTPARRPARSVLDPARLSERLGLALPPWREQLSPVLAELAANRAGGGARAPG